MGGPPLEKHRRLDIDVGLWVIHKKTGNRRSAAEFGYQCVVGSQCTATIMHEHPDRTLARHSKLDERRRLRGSCLSILRRAYRLKPSSKIGDFGRLQQNAEQIVQKKNFRLRKFLTDSS